MVTRGGEPAAAAPPPTVVRYFKVGIISQGQIKSKYVGNAQAVHYRGTQVFSWHFHAIEIYEYRDYGTYASATLSQACYGRRRSTCSPAKVSASLEETVNLVEDPDKPTRRTIACSRNDRAPKADGAYAVRPFAETIGLESSPSALHADLRRAVPKAMLEDKCWHGIGRHWISALEAYPNDIPACRGSLTYAGDVRGAYEMAFAYQDEARLLRAFRTSNEPISFQATCPHSLGVDHESYASDEHRTTWNTSWWVVFQPLKESQLEAAIRQLKKQKKT